MKNKLMPCPFCGGNATVTGKDFPMVMCLKCYTETNVYSTKEEAINAWNTRTNKIPVGKGEDYEVVHND